MDYFYSAATPRSRGVLWPIFTPALISATKLGNRDRALLLFLYNSGARAEEAAKLCIEDLSLHSGADGALSSVCLHGKGGKVRTCPLWISTTAKLTHLVAGRNGKERVFLNRRFQPLTRFGIHDIVTRYANVAMRSVKEMRKKRVGPHTIRHYLPFLTMSCNAAATALFLVKS